MSMTYEEAEQEARRRWGSCGFATWTIVGQMKIVADKHLSSAGGGNMLKGAGLTWEEAFTDADRRLNEGKTGLQERK